MESQQQNEQIEYDSSDSEQQKEKNSEKEEAKQQVLEKQPSMEQESEEIDIMGMLKKKKMYIIEKDFQKVEKGLSLEQFLLVMLEHLDYEKDNEQKKLEITLKLIDLFMEIDVNGDQTMEWEEFSNHIIELGLLKKDRTYKNVIKNYYLSESIIDKEKHESDIEQVYYFEKLKHLIVLEKESPKFKVYNSMNCELLCEVSAHKGSVLAAELLPEQNLLATSSNDLTINFWDTSSFNLKQILSTPEIQLTMKFADWPSGIGSSNGILYTGGSDAIIHYYDSESLKERGTMSGWNPFFKKDVQQYGHAGPIGDILPIYQQMTLVTCALDGKICLWDIPTHSFKKELQGHDKGVYSLAWSEYSQMNSCLISAGLDHEAFVWNTYVKEKIFLLRGHNHPLVGVKCLDQSPQVITADIAGMVKIWDVRNFLPVQTFNVPAEEINSFCLSYSTKFSMKKRIITAARNLTFFEYDEPKDQLLTDEQTCLKILYSEELFAFITLHANSIKIWDARTGKLQAVHRKLSRSDLTTCILDTRERKVFVGDADGRIFTVNIKNGAKMKKFQRHHKMVTDIAYWTSAEVNPDADQDDIVRRVITISREESVYIHDEDAPDSNKSVRYQMKQHKGSLNSLSLKAGSEVIGSCDDAGNIFLTNLSSYRQEQLLKYHNFEIKKILILNPYDCLCAIDSMGTLMFFSLNQTRIRNKLLITKSYKTQSITNEIEQFPATAVGFYFRQNWLILGDEFGTITVWDLSLVNHKFTNFFLQFLDKLEQFKIDSSKKVKRGKKKQRPSQQVEESSNKDEGMSFFLQQSQQTLDNNNKEEDILNFFPTEATSKKNFKKKLTTDQMQAFYDEDIGKIFFESDIQEIKFIKKCHQELISWIEVMEKYDAFATSSLDCCCHVWSLQDFTKLGSLLLGSDNKWRLKIDEEVKKKKALEQAIEMLDYLYPKDQTKHYDEDDDEEDSGEPKTAYERVYLILKQNQKKKFGEEAAKQSFKKVQNKQEKMFAALHSLEYKDSEKPSPTKQQSRYEKLSPEQQKKDKRIVKAEQLISKIKNLKPNEYLYGDKNDDIEKDLFQDEDEEENDYHILNELNDYKKEQLTAYSKSTFKSKPVKSQFKSKIR